MTQFLNGIVYFSTASIMLSILVVLFAITYWNYGHPPGSGIVALVVYIFGSPFWLLSSAVGIMHMKKKKGELSPWFYICLGCNLLTSYMVLSLFVFKVLLGSSL